MADYYQLKNQNIFNPPANTDMGSANSQFNTMYVQNALVLGNVSVTGTTIIAPRITTITYPGNDTAADTAGGQTITLTGTGFVAGASVLINESAVGVVSVVSSTVITFTSPANTTGSYVVYVVNPDGSTAIAIPGIQYSGTPNWTTAAGSLGNVYETASFNKSVTATGDAPITYSVVSGSLPPGSTFNANGTITGTSQLSASPTTYSFTVRATDAEQQDTNRAFSIAVIPDVVTWSSPTNNETYSPATNIAIANIALSATSAVGSGITYSANTLPTGLSITGANISGTPTVQANTSSLLTATANTTTESSSITINWVVSVASDPYFMYNSLLLPGASTTFVDDASTNNFAVSIFGDTKPNSFNPYTPGYYSNYLTSSSGYLSFASSATLAPNTSSFTMEFWYNNTSTGSGRPAGNGTNSAYGTNRWVFATNAVAAGKLEFAVYNYSSSAPMFVSTSSTVASDGQWHHVAVVRSGNTWAMFIDGVRQGSSVTSSVSLSGASSTLNVGWSNYTGDVTGFSGYISNFRLVNGSAVYDPTQTTITVPTSPLTAIANTAVLTCQSNRFIDNSTNNFALTIFGNTSIKSFDPFTPNSSYSTYGSGYFDGTGDYLTLPNNAALAFGSEDFCLEFWIYTTAFGSTDSRPLGNNNSWAANAWSLHSDHVTVNEKYTFWVNNYNSGSPMFTSTSSVALNTWTHVAITRSGTSWRMFVNGAQEGSTVTSSAALDGGSSDDMYIGGSGAANEYVTGYISNLRAVKGTAVYTTTFTPPSAPLTAIANTSLLTLQNNQSVNNSVFLDNSTNNFFVTRNGNTTQGSFSPYGPNWSNHFSTGSYRLSTTGMTAFGTDFTLELWIFPTSVNDYNTIFDSRPSDGAANGLVLGLTSASKVYFYTNGSFQITTTTAISVNTWTHIALVRSGSGSGNVKIYINGVADATTATYTTSFTSTIASIGDDWNNRAFLQYFGYLSNLRAVTSALYTSTFTPSTTPLTAVSGTVLLTCQSNRFKDNSSSNLTITVSLFPTVQRFSPFSPTATYSAGTIGGSGYFDGSDYLTAAADTAFDFGTGDFTIECWVYPINNGQNYPTFLASVTGWSAGASGHRFNNIGYANKFWFGLNGSGGVASGDPLMASTNTFSFNTWHHYAITRSGNTFRMFINGALENTQTFSGSYNAGLGGLRSGWSTWDGGQGYFTGNISNLRIVKGTAVYTANFVPPTAPVTAITNTSLLLNYTNAGIIDNTMQNDLETVGDAKISTAQSKFGGSSMSFDGAGDYLTTPFSPLTQFGTGDFTIEFWIYRAAGSVYQTILDTRSSGTGSPWAVLLNSSNQPYILIASDITSSIAVASATWTHIAICRASGTLRIFNNGVIGYSGANSTSMMPTGPLRIGKTIDNVYDLNGYLNDLRITKGLARYTANFTPPISAFPTF